MRPLLKPGLRPVWRDASTLQLGSDPDTALVVTGISTTLTRTISLLDGSLDERVVVGGRPDVKALLDVLTEAGAITDVQRSAWPGGEAVRARMAPDLAALGLVGADPLAVAASRSGARVDVMGGGRVGGHVARALVAAGVGTVVLRDGGTTTSADVLPGAWDPRDVGQARAQVLAGGGDERAPDLVVLCPHPPGRHDPDLTEALVVSRTPHLVAVVRETRGVVGPLVLPPEGPCLGCLDLHHGDADPAWSRVVSADPGGRVIDACDGPLATAVGALATRQALAWIGRSGGRPDRLPTRGLDELPDELTSGSLGATLELLQSDWRVRRRTWTAHPACSH